MGSMFSAKGRSRRSEFWLICIGLSVLAGIVNTVIVAMLVGGDWLASMRDQSPLAATSSAALSLLIFWPLTAAAIRRAHDRDQGGTPVLIFQLCGLAFTASDTVFAWMGGSWQEGPLFWAFGLFALIYLIAALYFLVTLGFLDGTRGPNRFGPSPKHSANYRAPAIDAVD